MICCGRGRILGGLGGGCWRLCRRRPVSDLRGYRPGLPSWMRSAGCRRANSLRPSRAPPRLRRSSSGGCPAMLRTGCGACPGRSWEEISPPAPSGGEWRRAVTTAPTTASAALTKSFRALAAGTSGPSAKTASPLIRERKKTGRKQEISHEMDGTAAEGHRYGA